MPQISAFPRISVVIPTLNEAQNLPYVLPYLPAIVSEVILVDGRPIDDTIAVAQQLRPDIKVVLETAKGKGHALRAGFAASTGDIIVMLDADGSANPAEIPLFVETLMNGADFAKGSRYMAEAGSSDLTLLRRVGNLGLNSFANMLFGQHFTDLCYGYNAFWRHCLEHVEVDCSGFEVETLLNLRMCKAKFEIREVPSFEHPRIYGESHLRTFHDGFRVLRTIMTERVNGRSIVPTRQRFVPRLAVATLQQSVTDGRIEELDLAS